MIAGDDAYGRGGANIFANKVGHTPINKRFSRNKLPLCSFYCKHIMNEVVMFVSFCSLRLESSVLVLPSMR